MMPITVLRLSRLALAGVIVIAAIAPARAQQGNAGSDCSSFPCGRVESIARSTVKQSWTPLGTGAGFNADSKVVTSFKIGPDLSNQGIVMLGAGGGAAYKQTPSSYEQPRWEVTIKLDNGQKRVVTVAYEPFVREGDRVRVAGNSLELID